NASAAWSDRYGHTATAPTEAPRVLRAARREKVIGCRSFTSGSRMAVTLDQSSGKCKRPRPSERSERTGQTDVGTKIRSVSDGSAWGWGPMRSKSRLSNQTLGTRSGASATAAHGGGAPCGVKVD